ncbi:RE1-silencing transcription factor, partial [Armadillidium nasatum]
SGRSYRDHHHHNSSNDHHSRSKDRNYETSKDKDERCGNFHSVAGSTSFVRETQMKVAKSPSAIINSKDSFNKIENRQKIREKELFGDDSSSVNLHSTCLPIKDFKKHSLLDLPMPPAVQKESFTALSSSEGNLRSGISKLSISKNQVQPIPTSVSQSSTLSTAPLSNLDVIKKRIGVNEMASNPSANNTNNNNNNTTRSLFSVENLNESKCTEVLFTNVGQKFNREYQESQSVSFSSSPSPTATLPPVAAKSFKSQLPNSNISSSINKSSVNLNTMLNSSLPSKHLPASSKSLGNYEKSDNISWGKSVQKNITYPFQGKFSVSNKSTTSKSITSLQAADIPLPTYPNNSSNIDTPQSPDNDATFSPESSGDSSDNINSFKNQNKNLSNTNSLPSVNMEAIQKALNFINSHDKKSESKNISYRYEDFVGPAKPTSKSEYYDPEESWQTSSEQLGSKDVDLRNKKDVDLRQIPGQYITTSFSSPAQGQSIKKSLPDSQSSNFSSLHAASGSNWYSTDIRRNSISPSKELKDVDMRSLVCSSPQQNIGIGVVQSSKFPNLQTNIEVSKSDINKSQKELSKLDVIRNRIANDQDKLFKPGQKGVAASQLESYKQKREKYPVSSKQSFAKCGDSSDSRSTTTTIPKKGGNFISVLDELLPEGEVNDKRNQKETELDQSHKSFSKPEGDSDGNVLKNNSVGDAGKSKLYATKKTRSISTSATAVSSSLTAVKRDQPIGKSVERPRNSLENSPSSDHRSEKLTGNDTIGINLKTTRVEGMKDARSEINTQLPVSHVLPLKDPRTDIASLDSQLDKRRDPRSEHIKTSRPDIPRDSQAEPTKTLKPDIPRDPRSECTKALRPDIPRDPRSDIHQDVNWDIRSKPKVSSRSSLHDQSVIDRRPLSNSLLGPRPDANLRDVRNEYPLILNKRPDHPGLLPLPVRRDPRLNADFQRDARSNTLQSNIQKDPRFSSLKNKGYQEFRPQIPLNLDKRWTPVAGNVSKPPFSSNSFTHGGFVSSHSVTARPPHPPIIPATVPQNSAIANSFTCLMMQGLPHYANSSHIYKFFDEYLLRDLCIELNDAYECKGTAYIHFPSHLSAKEALEKENGKTMHGFKIYLRICSVGILRQAKATNGVQNFDREKYLDIPSRPKGTGNPFYNPKPKPQPPPPPPPPPPPSQSSSTLQSPSVSQSSIIDEDCVEESEKCEPPFKQGYSNLCGVTVDPKASKGLQSFKIPKLRKTASQEDSAQDSKDRTEENKILKSDIENYSKSQESEEKCQKSKMESLKSNKRVSENKTKERKDKDFSLSSEVEKQLKISSVTKKNRRYHKIVKRLDSDSDSDNEKGDPDSKKESSKLKAKYVDSEDSENESSLTIDETAVHCSESSDVESEESEEEFEMKRVHVERVFPHNKGRRAASIAQQIKPREKKTEIKSNKKLNTSLSKQRGRRKKANKIDTEFGKAKITRLKHVEFKEILSLKKKLRVIIPTPLKLVYSVVSEDKLPCRGSKRRGRPASPSPSETLSETPSTCTTVSNSQDLLRQNDSLDLLIAETEKELKGDSFEDSFLKENSSKRSIPQSIIRPPKRAKKDNFKWQKGYQRKGIPVPDIFLNKIKNRKRSYSWACNKPKKRIKLSKGIALKNEKSPSISNQPSIFDDNILCDNELPDIAQITPSLTDNILPVLSSIESVIRADMEMSSEKSQCSLTSEKAKERIKMISNDLLETANKFTEKESQENCIGFSSLIFSHLQKDKNSNDVEDDDDTDLSLQVNQIVESLDHSIPCASSTSQEISEAKITSLNSIPVSGGIDMSNNLHENKHIKTSLITKCELSGTASADSSLTEATALPKVKSTADNFSTSASLVGNILETEPISNFIDKLNDEEETRDLITNVKNKSHVDDLKVARIENQNMMENFKAIRKADTVEYIKEAHTNENALKSDTACESSNFEPIREDHRITDANESVKTTLSVENLKTDKVRVISNHASLNESDKITDAIENVKETYTVENITKTDTVYESNNLEILNKDNKIANTLENVKETQTVENIKIDKVHKNGNLVALSEGDKISDGIENVNETHAEENITNTDIICKNSNLETLNEGDKIASVIEEVKETHTDENITKTHTLYKSHNTEIISENYKISSAIENSKERVENFAETDKVSKTSSIMTLSDGESVRTEEIVENINEAPIVENNMNTSTACKTDSTNIKTADRISTYIKDSVNFLNTCENDLNTVANLIDDHTVGETTRGDKSENVNQNEGETACKEKICLENVKNLSDSENIFNKNESLYNTNSNSDPGFVIGSESCLMESNIIIDKESEEVTSCSFEQPQNNEKVENSCSKPGTDKDADKNTPLLPGTELNTTHSSSLIKTIEDQGINVDSENDTVTSDYHQQNSVQKDSSETINSSASQIDMLPPLIIAVNKDINAIDELPSSMNSLNSSSNLSLKSSDLGKLCAFGEVVESENGNISELNSNTVTEIGAESDVDDGASIGLSSMCSFPDDSSVVSNEGREATTPEILVSSSGKKAKKEKASLSNISIERRRITRGSLVLPQVTETLLWDDGGIVDLFQCDQCDYVGKQRVSHIINFHYEREVPCEFRKEDYTPLLRDTLGPIQLKSKKGKLDLSWIPKQMIFNEEIHCNIKGCDYNSSSRFDFVYHLLEHVPEAASSLYHCRLCNFMTDNLTHFYDHVTSHTGEYRHTCDRCGQRGFSVESLIHHHKDYHGNQSQEIRSEDMILEDGWPYIHVCRSCHHVQITLGKIEEHIQTKHNGKADYIKANMSRHVSTHSDKKKELESCSISKKKESAGEESSVIKSNVKKTIKGKGKRLKKTKCKLKLNIDKPTNVPIFLGNEDENLVKDNEKEKSVEDLVNRILLNNYTTKSSTEIKKKISSLENILKKVDDSYNDNEPCVSESNSNDLLSPTLQSEHNIVKEQINEEKPVEAPNKDTLKQQETDTVFKHNYNQTNLVQYNASEKDGNSNNNIEVQEHPNNVVVSKSDKNTLSNDLSEPSCNLTSSKKVTTAPLIGIISRLKENLSKEDILEKIKEKESSFTKAPSMSGSDTDSDSENNLVICEDENSQGENYIPEPSTEPMKNSILRVKPAQELFPQNPEPGSSTAVPIRCKLSTCKYSSSSLSDLRGHMYQNHRFYLCTFVECQYSTVYNSVFDYHLAENHQVIRRACPLLNCRTTSVMPPSELVKHFAHQHPLELVNNTFSGVEITTPAVNENENFLRIESVQSLDPQSASRIFSSEGEPSQKQEAKAIDSQSYIGALRDTNPEAKKIALIQPKLEPPSSPSGVLDFPAADTLPTQPPTVPVFPLFIRYQSQRAFNTYTMNKAPEIFKCMISGCTFATDDPQAFRSHSANHIVFLFQLPILKVLVCSNTGRKSFPCCYCLVKTTSVKILVDHIQEEHSHCAFQCKYCLYRASTKIYLGVHLRKFHPDKEARYIKVSTLNSQPPANPPIEHFVHPYQCTHGNY